MNYNKKNVLVFGAGESGEGALALLSRLGAKAYIYDEDESKAKALASMTNANFVDKKSLPSVLEKAIVGVISPGVKNDNKRIVMAKAMGLKIISEIDLASSVTKAKKITVTGTNGKSSTVRLLSNVLSECGKYAVACGNIGKSFCRFADKLNEDDFAVIEASSFQLENVVDYHTDIAIILNITQDHVDRHGSIDNYVKAKMNVLKNCTQNDYVIANYDDLTVRNEVSKLTMPNIIFFSAKDRLERGVFVKDNVIYSTLCGEQKKLAKLDEELKLTTHLDNILAVMSVVEHMGLSINHAIKKINEFVPQPHTIEKIMTRKGVSYVDDSKGTNVSATLHAVDSIDGRLVLIVGGRGKGEDYSVLFNNLPDKVQSLVFYGENAEYLSNIAHSYGKKGKIAQSMLAAVEFATEMLDGEGTVLFSPASASFDNYANYKERGEAFVFAVNSYDE